MDSNENAPQEILLYGHPACSMMPAVRTMLEQSQAGFEYINIHEDEAARARVREINDGYESVPTLVFPDGSTLSEPSSDELAAKLETLGYDVPLSTRIYGLFPLVVFGVLVFLVLLKLLEII